MHPGNKPILAVNGGSSSIKFSLFRGGEAPGHSGDGDLKKGLSGKIERIGQGDAELTWTDARSGKQSKQPVSASDLSSAGDLLLNWLQQQEGVFPLAAIGHRVVHGGPRTEACLVDEAVLQELQAISGYDPDHLPGEIELMRLIRERHPDLPQIACFDTAFHTTLSPLAKLLPIPRRYERAGVRRYGFHGLSYSYILTELTRIAGAGVAGGAVIIAHLGSGASLAAVRDGFSVDTTMGFTPAGGVVMGTRPGDLDPGVLWYLLDKERFDAGKLDHFINHECGLLGVSETTSDMQELLERESSDSRAAEAVALFCYQVKKSIGAFSAVLGGLDALVFTGGIGERSAAVRSRICAGLEYLGVELDLRANADNAVSIAGAGARVKVYAIPTDEELMIAQIVNQLI
jgi:acetate kinase